MKNLVELLVSLCFAELVHNALEIWGMRQKVEWLRLSLQNEKHGRWPVNINTKFKTLMLHVLILLVISGISFILLRFLNLTNEFLIVVGIFVLVLNYILTTWKVDSFHTEIGQIIKRVRIR